MLMYKVTVYEVSLKEAHQCFVWSAVEIKTPAV